MSGNIFKPIAQNGDDGNDGDGGDGDDDGDRACKDIAMAMTKLTRHIKFCVALANLLLFSMDSAKWCQQELDLNFNLTVTISTVAKLLQQPTSPHNYSSYMSGGINIQGVIRLQTLARQ